MCLSFQSLRSYRASHGIALQLDGVLVVQDPVEYCISNSGFRVCNTAATTCVVSVANTGLKSA
jgi:hypothetical protein